MARFDTNRSAEMEVFVRVVDLGGFTQAARKLRLTPSGVSKLISRLETRLGSRLINRTTRRLTLTEEGQTFYQRALRILGEMEEAEREAASGAAPRGRLTVNCSIPFGMLHIMPLIPRFLERHPEITLDLMLTDTLIDLMQERADVAIRVGPLNASRLVARKLGSSRTVVVGAPNYLARFGSPKTPADLIGHRGIGWTFSRLRGGGWPFKRGDHTEEAVPPLAARVSDGETARRLALGGVGLARLALFHIGADIEAGRLVPVLQNFNPGDREDINAVYVGHTAPLPARVRAFIDFLAEHVRVSDPVLKRAGDGRWKLAE